MPGPGTVACELIQRAIALATRMGAPGSELAVRAGITAAELADRDARLPIARLSGLFDEIERSTGDEAFGLHLAEASRTMPDNVLALAVHSSPTLGEAFRRAARYTRLVNDAAAIEITPDGTLVHLRYRVDPIGLPHRVGAQAALGLLCLVGRQLVASFRAVRAGFRQRAPGAAAAAEFARILAAPVAFDAPVDELVVPQGALAAPLPKADPALVAHLDRHLDVLLERVRPADLQARVSRLLGERLTGGPPDVAWVAEQLHMSPRSLQRRLRDAGTSFQALRDTLRRDLAMRYLAQGIALSEVAFLVGFTEPSNFHRAFKRWTGMTPAEARRPAAGRADGHSASSGRQ